MKRIMTVAVLAMGLLFYCPNSMANEEIESPVFEPIPLASDMPEAGFTEFIDDIECEPIYPEPEPEVEAAVVEQEPINGDSGYIITNEDSELLVRIASLEAGNQGVEGMAHVMQVVLNRVESEKWPNSVSEVLYQEGQFATACNLAQANVKEEAWQALDEVCQGLYIWNSALFFESSEGLIWGKCHHYLFTYKGHDFYK